MSANLRRLIEEKGGAYTQSAPFKVAGAAAGKGGNSSSVTSSHTRISSPDSFIARVAVGSTVVAERVVNSGGDYGDNDPNSAKLKRAKKKQKKEKKSNEGFKAPGSLGNQNTSDASTATMSSKKWSSSSSSHERRSTKEDDDDRNDNGGNSSSNSSCWSKWAGPATVHAIEVVFAYRAGLYVTFFQLYRQGESKFALKYMNDR